MAICVPGVRRSATLLRLASEGTVALRRSGAGGPPAGCVGISPTVSDPRAGTAHEPEVVGGRAAWVSEVPRPPRTPANQGKSNLIRLN